MTTKFSSKVLRALSRQERQDLVDEEFERMLEEALRESELFDFYEDQDDVEEYNNFVSFQEHRARMRELAEQEKFDRCHPDEYGSSCYGEECYREFCD